MPPITPNLLLVDADASARERASSMLARFPSRLLVATSYQSAVKALTQNVIDLIICNQKIVGRGQQIDDLIAGFHGLPGRHDVPVLFTCNLQRSGVSLRTHPWGVAYHVHKSIGSQALIDLIQISLSLQVRPLSKPQTSASHQTPPRQIVRQPFSLTLPEVIMPPHPYSVSD